MATFLFEEIIFGPVMSRRLGVSLGVNLLPTSSKYCNFDCIYCECGWGNEFDKSGLPSREDVREAMLSKLSDMKEDGKSLDVITYAGNGEPTLHPEFADIIDDTIELRDKLYPEARIAVLSNATVINRVDVFKALKKIDDNILKLDSAFIETIELLNKPKYKFNIDKVVDNLKKFNGKLIIQTMFVKGTYNGIEVDNSTDEEIDAWIEKVVEINPMQVMIYTIDRDTPTDTLVKVPKEDLDSIAERVRELGYDVQVSY